MMSLVFYWVAANFLTRKKDWALNAKIKMTFKKLVRSFVFFKISKIAINNFDIKPKILKLFFAEYWINSFGFIILALINLFNNSIFFYYFFDSKIVTDFNWINALIFNFLFIIFTIKIISDCYKLSLRSSYRDQYLKIIFLDFFTLNLLSFLGILIYKKSHQKKYFLEINNNYQVNSQIINSQEIKEFFKTILKIEVFTLLINFAIFLLAVIIGYYVQNSGLESICLGFIAWTMFFFYAWIPQRIIPAIIGKKMFKNLLNNNDYFWLLAVFRFLLFTFGYYYVAILVNILNTDDKFREYLLQNF